MVAADHEFSALSLEAAVESAGKQQSAGNFEDSLARWLEIVKRFPQDPRGYYGSGNILRQQNRLAEAESVLSTGVSNFPSDEKVAVASAWVAHSGGDRREANRRWTSVRALFPQCFDGFFGGGAILRSLGNFDEADEMYRLAFTRFPISSLLLGDFAAVAQARGDREEAARRWNALHTLFPNRLEGLLRQERALREVGLYTEAEEVVADAVSRFPGNAEALIDSAQIAQARARWGQSLSRWGIVRSEFPALVDGYLGAAQCLNELGRFADAQAALQPALRMFPHSESVVSLSAWTYHHCSDFARAVAQWKVFRERFPKRTLGFTGAGASLISDEKPEDASAILEDARKRFPKDVEIAMQWARIPDHVSDWAATLQRWNSILPEFAESPGVVAGHALALTKCGQIDAAEKILESAMGQGMTGIEILQAYAGCSTRRCDWAGAVNRWRRVTEELPGSAHGWTSLGEALRSAGRLEESIAILRTALEKFPGNINVEHNIALSVSAQRNWKVALPLWEELKRKYPSNNAVRSAITQVLWQAKQDLATEMADGLGAVPSFVIPELLTELDKTEDNASDLQALFMKFESLGDTCEFGIVQRRYGAEPISLLRWTSTPPKELMAALDARFEGVGEAEYTVIAASNGEYTTRDRRYHMFSHTFTPDTSQPLDSFTVQHLRRMKYLRRKLVEDFESGEKIFVYKSSHGLSESDARSLFASIRRYGAKSALLCVTLENELHARGTLQELDDGLFFGYIDRFSNVDINFTIWVELCKKSHDAWITSQGKPTATSMLKLS